MRQLGNAVPVALACLVAASAAEKLIAAAATDRINLASAIRGAA